MASPQTTSLSQLLGKEDAPIRPQMPSQDPSAQFAAPPQMGGGIVPNMPITQMMPTGVSQGLSAPDGPVRKEFFGFKEIDWKSMILVFCIILILSSGLFSSTLRPYVPSTVGSDGRTTIVGSVIAAILGTVIFVVVKFLGKF